MGLSRVLSGRAARRAEKKAADLAKTLAEAPRTPYLPGGGPVMAQIMTKTLESHRSVLAQAFADLSTYNMVQPATASQKGVAARGAQWDAVSGGKAGKPSHMILLIMALTGAVLGVLGGLIVKPEDLGGFSGLPYVLPIPLAFFGALLGHQVGRSDSFYHGMMRVIVNERRTPIRPELVTGEVEIWIPKTLLSWRSHEWRYWQGRPYMWLQLVEARIQDRLSGTLDYLLLPNDPHRAKDAAVYMQRSINRLITDSALDLADIDKGEEPEDSRLKEYAPWVVPALITIGSLLLVIMTQ